MPSCSASSAPADTSITRSPRTGSRCRARASAISTATPVRLSLAPGTAGRKPISTMAASEPRLRTRPTRRGPLRPVALASETSAGPAMTSHHAGGLLVIASTRSGRFLASHCCACWRKTNPEGAASWWARTTRVCVAEASPAKAITLRARRGRRNSRRNAIWPPLMSSAIPAALRPAPTAPSSRCPRPAAHPAATEAAHIRPIGHA